MGGYTYILYSPSIDRLYIGATADWISRLSKHNAGYEKYTSKGTPWTLLWVTEKATKREAMVLERKLKNLNRKRLIEFMLKYEKDLRVATSLLEGL